MNLDLTLRNLAKGDFYQTLFSLGKELHSIQLFNNVTDFSSIQISFLRYLSYYSSIYLDIAVGDVDEIVLDNPIYTDSYIMYKNLTDKKKIKSNDKDEKTGNKSRWVFKEPPKK